MTDRIRRLLITGGSGFIGTNLVRLAVLERGYTVCNVDLLTYAGNRDSLADLEPLEGYELVVADICDLGAMEDVFARFRPEAVLHLAAESHVDRSIDGPAEFVRTNVLGTSTLLEAATAYWRTLPGALADAFRFIHVSTDEVYGSLGFTDAPFTEETRYDPHSPYAASKAAADHMARAWRDTYGLPVIVTNCSNNFGPFQFPEKLIPVVILNALAGEPIPVYGTGDNVRDWLYVRDHADALLRVLDARHTGADVQRRRGERDEQPGSRAPSVRAPRRAGSSRGQRLVCPADRVRCRPPGPRQALRHRWHSHPRRARMGADRETRMRR